MHFEQENHGGLFGGLTSLAAIFLNIISVGTVVETAVCAAIGAAVGYTVTYAFKKITTWLEKKFKVHPNKSDT